MGRKRGHRKRMNVNKSVAEIPNFTSEYNAFPPPAKLPTITRHNYPMYSTNYLPPPIDISPFQSRYSSNYSYPRRWLLPIPYWNLNPAPRVRTPVAIITPCPVVQVAVSPGPSALSAHGSVKSSKTSLHGVQVEVSATKACPLPSTLSSLHGVQVAVSATKACPLPSTLSAPKSVKSTRTSLYGSQVTARAANVHPVPSTLTAPNSVKSSRTLTEETSLSNTLSLLDQLASSQALTVYVSACEARKIPDIDPAMAPSTTHQVTERPANVGGRNTALNAETSNEEEEDVIYLYSVQPEKGKLIEVVDLSEDSNAISSERNLFLSSQNPSSQDETEMKQVLNKNSSDTQEVLKTPSITIVEINKGSVVSLPAGRKRKREENVDTHCNECNGHYVGGSKDDNQLFISKCGHIFCMSCLRNLVPYKCTECNAGISNLCKVIF